MKTGRQVELYCQQVAYIVEKNKDGVFKKADKTPDSVNI